MLFGRYWLTIPMLAIAGSLARKKIVPAGAGTLPTHTPLFVGLLVGVVILVGALTFVPALALGPIVEHSDADRWRGEGMTPMASSGKTRSLFDRLDRPAGDRRLVPQARLRGVRCAIRSCSWSTSAPSSPRCCGLQATVGRGEAPAWFIFWRLGLALVHRALRQLRRGDGRGTRQGPGGVAAQGTPRRAGQAADPPRARPRTTTWCRPPPSGNGDVVLVEAGDFIPADGEVIEGVASVDESAITGESAPVIRESGGDRSSVTGGTRVLSDWLIVRGHRQSRRDVSRPHDLAGRRRQAAEDAQRDRARHSCWPR